MVAVKAVVVTGFIYKARDVVTIKLALEKSKTIRKECNIYVLRTF